MWSLGGTGKPNEPLAPSEEKREAGCVEMIASILLASLPCCEDSAARTPKTDFLYCSFWLSTLPHHFALLPIFFFFFFPCVSQFTRWLNKKNRSGGEGGGGETSNPFVPRLLVHKQWSVNASNHLTTTTWMVLPWNSNKAFPPGPRQLQKN